MSRTIRSYWILILLGVCVHAACLVIASTRQPEGYALRSVDAQEYFQIATNLAKQGVFSRSEHEPLVPDTWRTPGYPLFLAAMFWPVGPSTWIGVLAQQVLSIVNVVILFTLARQLLDERRAWIAAALFLFEPYHLYYSLWLMATTLFTSVLLACWWVWLKWDRSRRLRCALFLGALSGLAVLIRPIGILIPLVIFTGINFRAWCSSRGSSVPMSAHARRGGTVSALMRHLSVNFVFVLTVAVIVGGWAWRNFQVAGHFALSHQQGAVLAYFKATEVVLWQLDRTTDRYLETAYRPVTAELGTHTVWEDIDARLRNEFAHLPVQKQNALKWENLAHGLDVGVDPFVISGELSDIAWQYMIESPVDTIYCAAVRCFMLLAFPLNLAIQDYHGISPNLLWAWCGGLLYSVLAACVVYRLLTRGFQFGVDFFPLAIVMALLVTTTPQLDPRFRVPMIPFLLVVALSAHKKTANPEGSAVS